MKFLSPEVALYLHKSTICACAPSCYLKLLKRICKNEYVGLLVLHFLLLLNPWLIIEMWPAKVFSIGITLVNVLWNWLNWFHFLFVKGGILIILIGLMIFLPSFLDVTRMSMSTVSFLSQLDSGVLCLYSAYPFDLWFKWI